MYVAMTTKDRVLSKHDPSFAYIYHISHSNSWPCFARGRGVAIISCDEGIRSIWYLWQLLKIKSICWDLSIWICSVSAVRGVQRSSIWNITATFPCLVRCLFIYNDNVCVSHSEHEFTPKFNENSHICLLNGWVTCKNNQHFKISCC